MTRCKLFFWWLATITAVMFPLVANWIIENFGGYFIDRMDYGNYRDILSLCFLASAFSFAWLMSRPSKLFGLRFTVSFIVLVVYLLAAMLPRPSCDEFIYLNTLENSDQKIRNQCE